MKLAPGQRQKLSQLAARRAHLRTNVEVYREQAKQQSRESSE